VESGRGLARPKRGLSEGCMLTFPPGLQLCPAPQAVKLQNKCKPGANIASGKLGTY
jgi:hypothetical protein